MGEEFHIGPWRVNPKRHRIERDGNVAYVEPKVMDVLLCLAEQPGAVVSRGFIMESVWSDVVVGDEVLTRAISELRKAFADDHRAPEVIATVPTVGYRLLLPIDFGTTDRTALPPDPVDGGRTGNETLTARRAWMFGLATTVVLLIAVVISGRFHLPPIRPAERMETVPVTSYPGLELDPAFSPSGTQIAFSRRRDPTADWNLFVRVIGTESVLRLTDGTGDRHPAWSPDGRYIAFIRTSGDACGIYTVPALGGMERSLAACEGRPVADLAWSPDGSSLAYSASPGPDEPFSIFILSLEEFKTKRLTAPSGSSAGDYYLAFTAGGEKLAFVREAAPGLRDVYRISLQDNLLDRLTSDNLSDNGLAVTPDGGILVFSTYHGSNYNFWRAPASGGSSHWVATGPGSASSLTIAPGSGDLAYVHWQYDTNIWRASVRPAGDTAAALQAFIVSTQEDARPQFSPDGTRIAFISTRSGLPEIWLSQVDGSNPVQLTSLKAYHASSPRWSPDSRRLVFDLVDSNRGTIAIYVVDVEGGRPRRLATNAQEGEATDMAPSWSSDGRWIYFGSDRSGSWQIWKVAVDGGRADRVTAHGGISAQESPNGSALYVVRRDTTGLRRLTAGSDVETFVPVPLNNAEDWGNWVVRNEGCYFIERPGPGRSGVAYFDFATRSTTSLLETSGVVQRNSGLSVAPDGRSILYTQEDHVESDIMLVQGFSSGL